MSKRVETLRKEMARAELDALVVSDMKNVRYLTGFTGSSAVLMVDSGTSTLFTDFRYAEQVEQETEGFDIRISKEAPLLEAARLKNGFKGKMGFESKSLSYLDFDKLKQTLPEAQLLPCESLVQDLRKVKDPYEIGKIRGAAEICDAVFNEILNEVRPGTTETELAAEIDHKFRTRGAAGSAFDTIVASGPRSSMPHARAGERSFAPGDMIIFDMGAVLDGYCSDMTRTVVLGRSDQSQKSVYELVLRAQKNALDMVRPGIRCSDLDRAARGMIEEGGYGENFGHRLGHGVGLEVHEAPVISSKAEDTVSTSMVFTVEPGVYLAKRWGVRIEDTIVVRESGVEILTRSPKEFLEL